MATPLKVLITGGAGQIGYSLSYQIANGNVFGRHQKVILVLLDIPPMKDAVEGLAYELMDCAMPLLAGVIPTVDEAEGFSNIDVAFLVGAMPRKEGMERKDLLSANVKIFKKQGMALAEHAKPTCKVLVVGNPANTNAYICARFAAPKIPARNITAMTRLDHNRATAQIAARCGLPISSVKNVIIWGNHSATQFPDVRHASVLKDGRWIDAYAAVGDEAWLRGDFLTTVQKRGAVIIQKRKLSSAMSAAKAACDHMRDWFHGTHEDDWVSMAVPSDGSYGVPKGIMYSFPVRINGSIHEWSIVKGLEIDAYSREKLHITLNELEQEKTEAEVACQDP